MQREIAAKMSCVLDGRDIGSYVLPNAEFKFYITASVAVRAKRRYSELKAKGYDVDLNMLEKEIEQRNKQQAILKFELKGIYHSENRHAALIVFKGSPQQPLKGDLKKADADLYYQGNEISDGYVLTEVKKRSVVITRGNEKIEIELTMLQGPEKPSKTLDSKPIQSPAIKK